MEGTDKIQAPLRHTPRQTEILATLPPELRFEFYSEEYQSITAWFDHLTASTNSALDRLADALKRPA